MAAIYLNPMSSKISNVEARERQRRRQSESGVIIQGNTSASASKMAMQEEAGPVRANGGAGGSVNRSQLYGGVEKGSSSGGSVRTISKFR